MDEINSMMELMEAMVTEESRGNRVTFKPLDLSQPPFIIWEVSSAEPSSVNGEWWFTRDFRVDQVL